LGQIADLEYRVGGFSLLRITSYGKIGLENETIVSDTVRLKHW